MAPGAATCEGGLGSLGLRVQSLRGALPPGEQGPGRAAGAESVGPSVWSLATASSELEWEKSGRRERQTEELP